MQRVCSWHSTQGQPVPFGQGLEVCRLQLGPRKRRLDIEARLRDDVSHFSNSLGMVLTCFNMFQHVFKRFCTVFADIQGSFMPFRSVLHGFRMESLGQGAIFSFEVQFRARFREVSQPPASFPMKYRSRMAEEQVGKG